MQKPTKQNPFKLARNDCFSERSKVFSERETQHAFDTSILFWVLNEWVGGYMCNCTDCLVRLN